RDGRHPNRGDRRRRQRIGLRARRTGRTRRAGGAGRAGGRRRRGRTDRDTTCRRADRGCPARGLRADAVRDIAPDERVLREVPARAELELVAERTADRRPRKRGRAGEDMRGRLVRAEQEAVEIPWEVLRVGGGAGETSPGDREQRDRDGGRAEV